MQTWNKSLIIFLLLITFGIFYLLAPVLTPFLIGALLAYLANPIVDKLTQWHVPRILSVVIVFMSMFSVLVILVLLLIPLIQKQIDNLIAIIPYVLDAFQKNVIPWLEAHLGIQQIFSTEELKSTLFSDWSAKAGNVATWVLKTGVHSGLAVIGWITNLLLIPVVTFYLLRDWKKLLKNLRDLLPRKIEPTVVKLLNECDEVLSAFFRGQLLVMLALGIIYSVGLMIVGLKVGLLLGLIAGLLSIVPYLGFIVGIVAASIAAAVEFGTFSAVVSVWLVFIIGQAIDGTLLTPNLVGDRIGLHPVVVILAVLAGGTLFGFFGVLLALPVAAIIMVWIRFINRSYRASALYK